MSTNNRLHGSRCCRGTRRIIVLLGAALLSGSVVSASPLPSRSQPLQAMPRTLRDASPQKRALVAKRRKKKLRCWIPLLFRRPGKACMWRKALWWKGVPRSKPAWSPPKATVFRGKFQQMAASAHPLATEAALQVMREGGTAMDAAITAAFAIGVVEPYGSGLGGGGFLLVYNAKTKKVESLDFRERAPSGASRLMYARYGRRGRRLSKTGHLAVGIPGMVAGMEAFARRYATKSWKRLLAPAHKLAKDGFPVYDLLEKMMRWTKWKFKRFSGSRKVFLFNGRTLKRGQRFRQADLAKTIARLQRFGARDFYSKKGTTAQLLIKEMKMGNGIIKMKDLNRYRVFWQKPLVGAYRGHTVYSMGTPSSGGAHLLQMLNILSGYPLPKMAPASGQRLHLLAESMRLSFADRAKFQGDARFANVPMSGIIAPAYAAKLRKQISLAKAAPRNSIEAGKPGRFGSNKNTTHLTTVDRWGNAVSMTLTINTTFGSGVVARGTGIVLNNEMDDFTANPGKPNAYKLIQSEANSVQPLKTPLSSMTPTIVLKDGKLQGTLGSPGGPKIITTVLQLATLLIDQKLTALQAVRFPRIHHQWRPAKLVVERPSASNRALYRLRRMGHQLKLRGRWSNAMVLWIDPKGQLTGAADPRGDGVALGF